MAVLNINVLDGIPSEFKDTIYRAMKSCTNKQVLAVCLYFMSDLPDREHHLQNTEHNLRLIYPHANIVYSDFQASNIRHYFNFETLSLKRGKIDINYRLWKNVLRGHWRNTDLGNQYAVKVLAERNIYIQKKGDLVSTSNIREIEHPYLKETLVDSPIDVEADRREQQIQEALLRLSGGDTIVDAATRIDVNVSRIVRDTKLSQTIKLIHNHKCQICNQSILLSEGDYYIEAHHIKPLGAPHNGPDIAENIIILCPNHHVMCDYGAIKLDASKLNQTSTHRVNEKYIQYHNTVIHIN